MKREIGRHCHLIMMLKESLRQHALLGRMVYRIGKPRGHTMTLLKKGQNRYHIGWTPSKEIGLLKNIIDYRVNIGLFGVCEPNRRMKESTKEVHGYLFCSIFEFQFF